MSQASDYLENALLDHVLSNTALTSPTTVYVGLFTSDPSLGSTDELLEAGNFTTEITGNGYSRKQVTFDSAASGSATTNANVTFDPASGGDWGTITHIAITDNSGDGVGNCLFYGRLQTAKEIQDGDTFQITSGNLTVTLA